MFPKEILIALSALPFVTASDLILTGVIDGPLPGGLPKAVEVYALNDIPDLSIYGIGFANNGGGSDGEEFSFPGGSSATAGQSVTIASEAVGFNSWFEEDPNYTTGFAAINGDDAIELYFNGAVVDVMGDINVDGTGQPWEYLDGWAHRKDGSSPSASFDISQWTFSGINKLDGCITNSGCGFGFPYKTFTSNTGPPATNPPATNPPATNPPGSITRIHEIQGAGSSVAITTPVTVEAVVTSLFYSSPDSTSPTGFFIQEEDAYNDSDPNTSEGIYVYCGTGASYQQDCQSVTVGNLLSLDGQPGDSFDMSQIDVSITGGSVSVTASSVPLPTPVDVVLPASGSTKDATTFENIEGMLVRFTTTLVVSEYYNLARYGEVVLTETSRPYQFTHHNAPSATGYSAFLDTLATRRIILDDSTNFQNAATLGTTDKAYAYPTGGLSLTNKFRGGDTITNLTGVLHWSWAGFSGTDAWRLRPVQDPAFNYVFTHVNPSPNAPNDVGGTFKVASFNVLNYFKTLNQRGANSEDELNRQRAKIVSAMEGLDADVLGLIEIENDLDDQSTADLVQGLNDAMGAGTYDYLATGSIGTDQIKVAFIYKPATVNLVGNFAILDSSIDDRFIDNKNRPVLIQTFEEISTGGRLTVAVNHFKSKGSSCDALQDPDLSDGQANCAQTRANAADALADYLLTDPTGSNDPDFLIIGDLNAYKKEDAIQNLINAGYTDLAEAFEGSTAYSYVFDGQIGYLDYALANSALLSQITGLSEWHVNADELPLFDYNDCVQDANEASFYRKSCVNDIYAPDALRSSDHDPVVIGMSLDGSTVPPTSPPVSNLIFFEGFENGFGNFIDGGRHATIVSQASNAFEGTSSLQIRKSGTQSSAYTNTLNVVTYSSVKVEFKYKPKGINTGDGFFLEYKVEGTSAWIVLSRYESGVDFENINNWNTGSVTWDIAGIDSLSLRFRCDAESTKDKIYIDNVNFEGVN